MLGDDQSKRPVTRVLTPNPEIWKRVKFWFQQMSEVHCNSEYDGKRLDVRRSAGATHQLCRNCPDGNALIPSAERALPFSDFLVFEFKAKSKRNFTTKVPQQNLYLHGGKQSRRTRQLCT